MANKAKDIMDSIAIAMLVVIFVVIAAMIVSTITDSSVFTDIPSSGVVTNETGAYINATGYTLDNAGVGGFASPVITAIYNATSGGIVGLGNASVSASGIVTNATATNWGNVTISYTYNFASGTSQAGVNITEIRDDFGSFVTNLIAFLAVIGTILGVVWLVLYVRKLFDKKEGINNLTA